MKKRERDSATELGEEGQSIPKLWGAGFVLFSLLVSSLFFLQARSSSIGDFSGDQINILTLCVQRDFPGALKDDLIVGDPSDTAYYIPSFVSVVRFLSLPDHDYIRGLSILLFVATVVYLCGWFLLLSLWRNLWVAATFAFLAHGILWPPGNEFWGIAGLWTVVPRTVFLAIVPWIVWLWLRYRRSLYAGMLAFLGVGLLANLHPISGLAVATGMLGAQFYLRRLEGKRAKDVGPAVVVCLGMILLGLVPSLITYFFGVKSAAGVNSEELLAAMHQRLRDVFFDPSLYWKQWLKPNWIAFVVIPTVSSFLLWRRFSRVEKDRVIALGLMAIAAIVLTIVPLALAALANRAGWRAPFTYDVVRAGKYIILPSLVCLALLTAFLLRRLPAVTGPVLAGVVLVVSLLAGRSTFNGWPVMGDDIVRSLWPAPVGTAPFRGDHSLDEMLAWIRSNTSEDAKFVGPRIIRVGAHRSVVHDTAGAGMLVAGNPQKFVHTIQREEELRKILSENPSGAPGLVAGWNADYWVVRRTIPNLEPAYSASGWYLYDLRRFE